MKIKIDWNKLGSAVGYVIASGAVTALLPQPYKQYAPIVSMIAGIIHPSPFDVSPAEQTVVSSLAASESGAGRINLAGALEAAVSSAEAGHDGAAS